MAAIAAGEIRNATGSYMLAFIAAGAACMLAALLALRIARRPVAVAAAE